VWYGIEFKKFFEFFYKERGYKPMNGVVRLVSIPNEDYSILYYYFPFFPDENLFTLNICIVYTCLLGRGRSVYEKKGR